jgi:hypothetical protein
MLFAKNNFNNGITRFVLVAVVTAITTISASAQDTKQGTDSKSSPDDKQTTAEIATPKTRIPFVKDFSPGRWTVTTSVDTVETFDDNILLSDAFRLSDTITQITPSISAGMRGRRGEFFAYYTPQISLYRQHDGLNTVGHTYLQAFAYDYSRFTRLTWNADAHMAPSRGNVPSAGFDLGPSSETSFRPVGLDSGLLTYSASSTLGLSHRLNARNRIYVEGTAGTIQFKPEETSSVSQLNGSRSYSTGVRLNWDYDVKPGRSIGVETNGGVLVYRDPNHQENYQSVLLRVSQKLPRHFGATFSAGPRYSERKGTSGTLAAGNDLSYSISGGLSHTGRRDQLEVSFDRSLQIGFLQGSVSNYGASARYSRMVRRKNSASATFGYVKSENILVGGGTNSYSGSLQLTHNIDRHWSMFARYSHMRQDGTVILSDRTYDRNQVAIGFTFRPNALVGR